MSYILDALRKADAQRERDPVRGIHAQPVRVSVSERRLRDGHRLGWWVASAAGLAAVASVGWYLSRDSRGVPGAPAARTQVAAAAPTAVAAPAPASAPAAAVPATAVLPPPPPVVAPPAAAPRAAATPSTKQAEPAPTSPAMARPASAPSPAAAQAARPAPGAAVPGAPATAAPAMAGPLIAGLPADAPKLAISGGVYSANAAQRMLIVNGQVFNEGGEVGPGVLLEEIRPKMAVLRFRGSRYTVGY